MKIFYNIPLFTLLYLCYLDCEAQYSGGVSTGYGLGIMLESDLTQVDSLYNGGLSNGFYTITNTQLSLSLNDGLYKGGNDDGNSTATTNLNLELLDSLYNGGYGKGEVIKISNLIRLSLCNDNLLVWNGNQNILWGNASNWDCGSLPTSNSLVSIPSGMTRYPTILSNVFIKQLWLYPSASLTISPIGKLNVKDP
jgi:hypothetical protein